MAYMIHHKVGPSTVVKWVWFSDSFHHIHFLERQQIAHILIVRIHSSGKQSTIIDAQ